MRYEVVEVIKDVSYYVRDNDATQYRMPDKAVSMFLRKGAAKLICDTLNDEWRYFLEHGG